MIMDNCELKNAFLRVAIDYGKEYARQIERLFRLETRNFQSGQFLKTYSPGMEIAGGTNSKNTTFPYGWSSLRQYSELKNIDANKFHLVRMNENGTGLGKTFIGFPSIQESVGFVAWFIKNVRKGRFGYWYSLEEPQAKYYENNLSKFKAEFV